MMSVKSKCEYVFTQPLRYKEDMTQAQFLKRGTAGLNSEFFLSWASCLTKARKLNLPSHLPRAYGKANWWIHAILKNAKRKTNSLVQDF